MMSVFFGVDQVENFYQATLANHQMFNKFFHHLLSKGIYLPPSGYETWFISRAIGEEELDKTYNAVRSFEP